MGRSRRRAKGFAFEKHLYYNAIMKIRLYHKLLVAFLLLSTFSVVLTIGSLRYVAGRHFREYVQKKELERAEALSAVMAEVYTEAGGWGAIERNPRVWHRLIRAGRFEPPTGPAGDGPLRGHRGPHRRSFRAGVRDRIGPGARLGLFDANKHQIAGSGAPTTDFALYPIAVDGAIVGWVGLKRIAPLSHPLDREFARQQVRAFYLIGGAILLLSVVISVLVSRHLLSPVRRLTDGTRLLAERRFDTRIPVTTSDELGSLARDFNAMAEQLGRFEQRQQQWLSDISHELRTPLSVLIGEIEALQDGVRMPVPETLASLRAEAAHIQRIVSDLHDLSLAEAGAMTMNRQPIEPVALLADVISFFRERFREQDLTLDVMLPDPPGPTLRGDDARIRQVLINLFENVLQHADTPGALRISGMVEKGGLRLTVEDSGPGVPASALPRLFDRLYRVDPARSRLSGGSGLGLSICKSIVEAHGGMISAANGDLGGLRIDVFLPGNEQEDLR